MNDILMFLTIITGLLIACVIGIVVCIVRLLGMADADHYNQSIMADILDHSRDPVWNIKNYPLETRRYDLGEVITSAGTEVDK
jgi:hypothetical protein